MTRLRVASDIGGTFTDTVVIDEGSGIGRFKAPTVPSAPAAGVLATLELAAADMGLPLRDFTDGISFLSHGTTVATNALLEGKVARTALIQTRGFGDTVTIMRGFKSFGLAEAAVKDFRTMVKQAPVVPKQLIGEATERIDYRGRVVVPLDEEDARRTLRHLAAQGAEVFAVSLLWSFKNEAHERRLQKIIADEVPGALVTLSYELLPRMGEFRAA